MSRKLSSTLLKSMAVLVIGLALFVPGRVMAFSYADSLIATDKATKLCEARGADSEYCVRATTYKFWATAANGKDNKDKYIQDNMPAAYQGDIYRKTLSAYDDEVKKGNISQQSDTGSNVDQNGDCEEGAVQVSIAVKDGENCVGSDSVNPIYAYLRNIIIFMGGAIGLAVVITIIIAGIQYSSSAGNAANIAKAKERLTNAVIGLVLYLFLAAILRYLVPQIFT